MNFLAHLHIASVTNTSFVGNFLGDFVKGDPDGQFNADIVQGIRVHRFIDSYTDQHEIVRSLKGLFPEPLRRFSPITLDMFWDHCLAKHWQEFAATSLVDFCQHAQRRIEAERRGEENSLPPRFEKVSQLAWQNRWFERYAELETITLGLQRIASRSPRMAPLADTSQTLQGNYQLLSEQFFILYPDVLEKAGAFITDSAVVAEIPAKT
jgi:acyl carrier protein phosphodiesterase